MNTERLERALYEMRDSLERFSPNFNETLTAFCRAVDKIVRVAGMQAENDQRKHRGEAMAYTEADFSNV